MDEDIRPAGLAAADGVVTSTPKPRSRRARHRDRPQELGVVPFGGVAGDSSEDEGEPAPFESSVHPGLLAPLPRPGPELTPTSTTSTTGDDAAPRGGGAPLDRRNKRSRRRSPSKKPRDGARGVAASPRAKRTASLPHSEDIVTLQQGGEGGDGGPIPPTTTATTSGSKHATRKRKKLRSTTREPPSSVTQPTPTPPQPTATPPAQPPHPPAGELSVTIHRADKLRPHRRLVHPVVRVHLLDAAGRCLSRSEYSDPGSALPASQGSPHVTAQVTNPFHLRQHRTLAPAWEETLRFEESGDLIVQNGKDVVIAFEILDFAGAEASNWAGLPLSGLTPFAWAFLRVCGSQGHCNLGQRARLQLYVPATHLYHQSEPLPLPQQQRPRWRANTTRGPVAGVPVQPVVVGGDGGAEGTAPSTAGAAFQPEVGHWFSDLTEQRTRYPGSLHVTVRVAKLSNARRAALRQQGAGALLASTLGAGGGGGDGGGSGLWPAIQRPVPVWQRLPGQLCHVPNSVQQQLWAGERGAFTLAFSHDGTRLAAGCGGAASSYPIHVYTVVGAGSKQPPDSLEGQLVGHHNIIYDLEWGSDDSVLLSASSDGTACLWDGERYSPAPIKSFPHPCFVYCARFLPGTNNQHVLTGSYDGCVRVWDSLSPGPSSQLLREFQAHSSNVNSLIFDSLGIKMFTACGSGTIKIWSRADKQDVTSWTVFRTIVDPEVQGYPINSIQLHPLGRRLLVHARDNMVRIFDLRTYSFMQHLSGATNFRSCVRSCFSPCGTMVVAGSEDGQAYAWNTDTGELLRVYEQIGQPQQAINDVVFHPLDNIVAFASFTSNHSVVLSCYDPAVRAAEERAAAAASVLEPAEASEPSGMPIGPHWSLLRSSLLDRTAEPARLDESLGQPRLSTTMESRALGMTNNDPTMTLSRSLTLEDNQLLTLQKLKEEHVQRLLAGATTTMNQTREMLEAGAELASPMQSPPMSPLLGRLSESTPEVPPTPKTPAPPSSDRPSRQRGTGRSRAAQKKWTEVTPFLVVAKHRFTARKPDELSIRRGEHLTVFGKKSASWWMARKPAGESGLIPSNYVEEVAEESAAAHHRSTGAPLDEAPTPSRGSKVRTERVLDRRLAEEAAAVQRQRRRRRTANLDATAQSQPLAVVS